MRILQITRAYYPRIGGIEQVSRDIVRALNSANDIEQKVICLGDDGTDGDLVRKRSQSVHDWIDGVEIIRCGSICSISSQLLSPSYPFVLHQVMKEFDPNIVLFHYPNPYMAAFLLAHKRRNFKLVIYWNLDITKQRMLGKLFHGQTMELLQRAEKIITHTANYINGSPYLKKFQDKCTIIPCCVDTDRLDYGVANSDLTNRIREKYAGKIICFTCGRHVPYKGLTYLIKASSFLDDRFHILIGGSGTLTDELKREATGDEKIEFLGRLTDEELTAYYAACDIFCFPSITKNESFGLALAEAMYFEKPAVTFTIPGSGVNFVNLNGVTGIECPSRDSKKYAEALKKLADDLELREKYGRAARQRVLNNFTKEIFAENLMKLFDSME